MKIINLTEKEKKELYPPVREYADIYDFDPWRSWCWLWWWSKYHEQSNQDKLKDTQLTKKYVHR